VGREAELHVGSTRAQNFKQGAAWRRSGGADSAPAKGKHMQMAKERLGVPTGRWGGRDTHESDGDGGRECAVRKIMLEICPRGNN
jgi:hypothetical protein